MNTRFALPMATALAVAVIGGASGALLIDRGTSTPSVPAPVRVSQVANLQSDPSTPVPVEPASSTAAVVISTVTSTEAAAPSPIGRLSTDTPAPLSVQPTQPVESAGAPSAQPTAAATTAAPPHVEPTPGPSQTR